MKILLADNGLMGSLHSNPGIGRALDHGPDLVVGGGALALGHDAQIDLVFQDAQHRPGAPLGLALHLITCLEVDASGSLVLHGGQHPQGVEVIRNILAALPGDPAGKYLPYHLGGLGIDHQPVFILRVFGVSVDGEGADKFPVPALHVQVAADFDGRIPAVTVVHQIFEGQHQAAGAIQVGSVVVVIDSDEAYPQGREQPFNVVARLNVLTAESGQILDHHAVDLAGLHGFQHLPDVGPVEAGAGVAVIVALHDQMQLRVPVDVGVDQIALVSDAVALRFFVQVLFGQAAICITKKFHEKTS